MDEPARLPRISFSLLARRSDDGLLWRFSGGPIQSWQKVASVRDHNGAIGHFDDHGSVDAGLAVTLSNFHTQSGPIPCYWCWCSLVMVPMSAANTLPNGKSKPWENFIEEIRSAKPSEVFDFDVLHKHTLRFF